MFSIALAGISNLLLLHQLRIRTIIHHALAEDRSCERAVDLLRIDISQLSIEYELVALRPKTHCGLSPEQSKGEDIAILDTISLRL